MSFGFGVGDFIAVGELAWKVAERCKSAPDDFAELTVSLEVIASVLDETTSFVRQGSVPGDELKRNALATARESCRVTLAEVQTFLDKHAGVEKGKKFFDIVRFIRHDIKGLKSKLQSSCHHLQLCLTALSSLSILNVQKQLRQILSEYKTRVRESTVLSDAINDSKMAPEPELFDQLIVDLEDKDVHPDAISLNSAFIQSWLKQAIRTGQLQENAEQASSDLPPPEGEDGTEKALPIPGIPDPDSDPASDSDPEHGMPSTHALDIGDLQSVSRSASMSSHRSKPVNWHPSDKPEPEFVQQMLEPILSGLVRDGFPEPGSPETKAFHHRFRRAYHQLDYTGRGFVTKSDVTDTCQEALQRASLPFDQDKLLELVSASDENQDNRFDLGEFIQLMENLFFEAARSVRGYLKDQMSAHCKQAEKDGQSRPIAKEPIPWPFVPEDADGKKYRNTILDVTVTSHPRLHQTSFSMMMVNAEACRVMLDRLEAKWRPIIPHSLRSSFLGVFETLRKIALRYSLFENPILGAQCSDIDDGITYLGVAGLFDPENEFPKVRNTLIENRDFGYRDLLRVQGVMKCLESIDKGLGPVIYAHQFQKLNAAWQMRHVNDIVTVIAGELGNWDEIVKSVKSFRQIPRTELQQVKKRSVLFILRYLGHIPWILNLKSATLLAEPEKKKKKKPSKFGFGKPGK